MKIDSELEKEIKAQRKIERRAALLNKLKSLIIPTVITLIIAGFVIYIMNMTEEKPTEEIIKVSAYDGDTSPIELESNKLKFVMDPTTTQFEVLVKDTGMVWTSTPADAASDAIASKADKDKLQSTIILTYSNKQGTDVIYNNYTYSIENQIYEIEKIDNTTVRVNYSIGDTQKVYMIPTIMTAERYEKYVTNSSDANAKTMMSGRYKKYDLDHLGKKDKAEDIIEKYPCIEEKRIIYVLNEKTNDSLKQKFEEIFEAAGYSEEEYVADKELVTGETKSDKPVFNVSVIYRLEGDELVVEVPMDSLEYRSDFPILYVSILPNFGAGSSSEEGFMLIPEGSGALINFNNGKVAQNDYYANVYGWDDAIMRKEVVQETRTNFGVFGVSKNKNSFICILEDGSAYASVQANISGKSNSYNQVSSQHSICHREQYDVAGKVVGNMFKYEEEIAPEKIVNRYCFINSDSYVEMANAYRDYLTDQYKDLFTKKDEKEAPVVVEVLGAVDKITQVLGVPTSKPLKLTTFTEANDIIKELKNNGFRNMSVKMSGWANGGIRQELMKSVSIVSDCGSKKDLQYFIDEAKKSGIDVYLDGVTNYAYHSGLFEGFIVSRDAARLVSNEKAELYPHSKITFGQLKSEDAYYLLRASLIQTVAEELADTAQQYGTGVSYRNIGKDLASDFRKEEKTTREMARINQVNQIKAVKDSGSQVMVNVGNDYALPYVDMVTNMDLGGISYTIIDKAVPFLPIAIHGYVNYTGEALNLTQDENDELLHSVESGAGLYFTIMKETAFALQKTLYSEYFGASYDAWSDKMIATYTRYNQELGHTFNQKIVDHGNITQNITCTKYEDGTKVYVNYGFEDYMLDGTKLYARDYLVVR